MDVEGNLEQTSSAATASKISKKEKKRKKDGDHGKVISARVRPPPNLFFRVRHRSLILFDMCFVPVGACQVSLHHLWTSEIKKN